MASEREGTTATHILVVDDHPDTRIILRHYLEAKGFTVREADDGLEALAEMRSARPAAVILDIQMPHLDGIGVLKAVRSDELLKAIPILALSAHALSDEVQRIKDAGADRYLAKPADPKSVLAALKELLNSSDASADDGLETT